MPKNLWIRIRYEKVHYYNLPEFVKDPDRCLLLDLLNDEMVACGYAKIAKDRPWTIHIMPTLGLCLCSSIGVETDSINRSKTDRSNGFKTGISVRSAWMFTL